MSTKHYVALLIFSALLSLYVSIGIAPLFDVDEGAFSEATREMLDSGNYLTTYLNGELRFDKPVLTYWAQALSVTLFGLNEAALRLPSSVAASLWAGIIFVFARKYHDTRTAFLAAMFMLLSAQVSIIGKAAIADALLNLFIATSMLAMYDYFATRRKAVLMIAFAAIALGVLTKGPVAILIPFTASFIFAVARKQFKFWLASVFNPYGLALFLVIAAPWYLLEYLDQGQKFIDGFFLKHNVGRFNDAMEGHNGSYLYYLPVLLFGLLPFTGIFIKALTRVRRYVDDDLNLYLLIWFGFVLVFFSLSGTKLPHYIIYGYTPLFILMAQASAQIRKPSLVLIWPLLAMLALFFLPDILLGLSDRIKDEYARYLLQFVEPIFSGAYPWITGTGVVILLALLLVRVPAEVKYFTAGVITVTAINFALIPAAAEFQQVPIKQAAAYARDNQMSVNMYRLHRPSFGVYSRSMVERGRPEPGDIVLTEKIHLDEFKQVQVLFEKYGIILFRYIE